MTKRYWEWPRPFAWEPEHTALLIVDMQRGFVEEGALLEVPMAREQTPTIATLLRGFRQRGLPVVYTRYVMSPDFHIPFYRARAPLRGYDLERATPQFHPDDELDTPIIEELAPASDELVVDKCGYDGFADTRLDGMLRGRGVDTLVVAGTVVNWCVDSTVRTAFHRRYQTIVVADGVSGYDHAGASGGEWVARELDFFAESMAMVLPSHELLAALDDPALRQPGIAVRSNEAADDAVEPAPRGRTDGRVPGRTESRP